MNYLNISDSFEILHNKLKEGKGKYKEDKSEDRDEYKAENVFFIPNSARWSYLRSRSKLPEIGKNIDSAMNAIERDNPSLKNVLPKVYAKGNLNPVNLGKLIDEFSNIDMEASKDRSLDVLAHTFEYFLGQFGIAEGKKGSQFYTPISVVKLLVEMLEPYKGRMFDPCCGTGTMLVQSKNFIKEHQGLVNAISIYGQESNQTTWRLAKVNLAIRGIGSSQVKWNNEGSFLKNEHPDLQVDFIIANPPFNDSNWSGDLLRKDARWKYAVPPEGNANYAWIQHFVYHLAAKAVAGFVMAKSSLSSKSSNEYLIRKNLVDAGLVDCLVNLPTKLFFKYASSCIALIFKKRKEKKKYFLLTLIILAVLSIAGIVCWVIKVLNKLLMFIINWKENNKAYKDISGFCSSRTVNKVKELDYVLIPRHYVGLSEEDFDFSERFNSLKSELEKQMKEEALLNKRILEHLSKIDYEQ